MTFDRDAEGLFGPDGLFVVSATDAIQAAMESYLHKYFGESCEKFDGCPACEGWKRYHDFANYICDAVEPIAQIEAGKVTEFDPTAGDA